jgi:chorismate synthase
VERSDICVVPAAAIVGEAMVAMVLASVFTDKFGCDSRTEIEANFNAYENRGF